MLSTRHNAIEAIRNVCPRSVGILLMSIEEGHCYTNTMPGEECIDEFFLLCGGMQACFCIGYTTLFQACHSLGSGVMGRNAKNSDAAWRPSWI